MCFLSKNFVPLSLVLSGCLYSETFTADGTLKSSISNLSGFNLGSQSNTYAAGLLINSQKTSVNLTINPQNTSVSSFSNQSIGLYGIFSNTALTLQGTQNESLTFQGISTQRASVTGIKTASLVVDNASIVFQSISSAGNIASNSDIRGIDSHSGKGLNLTLTNHASITFKSITSTSNYAYLAGIATGYQGASSNLNLSGGKISFDKISGVENTVGIAFQATNNTLSGDIVFSHIESTGDLTFNGKPIARNAYGISFAPSASATLKENSKIYITSMDSKGGIFLLYAQQALSLTFEKNAGIIYGAISENEKANSYGIYAKTDKNLNYYFGAGDQAGNAPAGAKGTIFESIESTGSNDAYGMYLQTTNQASFNINGQAVFQSIQADSGNAYGIYASGSMSLEGVGGGEKKLSFTSITSQSAEATGLGIAQNSTLTLGGGLKLEFGGISASKYAIKNQGKLIINQVDLLSFGTLSSNNSAISNTLENLSFKLGTTEIGDGSTPIAIQYGFYNSAQQTKLDGSLSVKNFNSPAPFSLIYYARGGGQSGNITIDNLSISAYGNQSGSKLFGFNATQNLQLTLNNTLNITLMNEKSEGVAFGENISLSLGENARVIFNADGGKLANLSNLANQSGGIISLAGEIKETQEPTNRIWKDTKQSRNFNARHLQIQNLQTQNTQFVLYADKGAQVVNPSDTNLYGKAFSDGASATSNRTAFGGSDSIAISGTTSSSPVSNNLVIALGGLNESNKDMSQNVVLAIVDSSANVTFNGLTKSGDSTIVESHSEFDVFDLEIKRFDNASGKSFYYSNLVAYNPKFNTSYLASLSGSLNINFLTLSGNLNSLSKRLGDLKDENNTDGVWARVFGGEQIMNFGIQTKQSYITTQVGYDREMDVEEAKNFLGIALSYSYASSVQDESLYHTTQGIESYTSKAKTHEVEIALYDTYRNDSGLYSDSIAKFGYFLSDIDLYKNLSISDYSNFAFMLSEEVGYELGLGSNQEWMITPQGELAYAFMNEKNLGKENFEGILSISSQDLHLLRMRAGINWGYRFNNNSIDKIKALLYVGTYYEYDAIFGGDKTFSSNISGTNYNDLCSNGRFVLNLGTDIQINEMAKLYFDFEKSFGDKMYKNYQVNFGMRYSFGEKPQKTPLEQNEIQQDFEKNNGF